VRVFCVFAGALGGADAKHRFAGTQLCDPVAIAEQVAARRITHAAGMRVYDADFAQSFVVLPEDEARQGLGVGVEANVSFAGVAFGAGGQGGQSDDVAFFPVAQEKPAEFLVAARRFAMLGVIREERPQYSFRHHNAFEPATRYCERRGRDRRDIATRQCVSQSLEIDWEFRQPTA
jgi:hypothetical protein